MHLLSLAGSPLVIQNVSLVSWLSPWQVPPAVSPLHMVHSCSPRPWSGGDIHLVAQMPWSTHCGSVISGYQVGAAPRQSHELLQSGTPMLGASSRGECKNVKLLLTDRTHHWLL